MLDKIRNNKFIKWLSVASLSAFMAVMSCLTCFAADESSSSSDVSGALSGAFDTMKGDIMNYVVIILPIALAVVGIFFGIKKAIAFFKSTAK